MNVFRFFWTAHKWTGIVLAGVLVLTAVTGFLLLLKKDYAWIQPPTQKGEPGPVEAFLTMEELWGRIAAQKHPHFESPEDIDRIDMRPSKFVYKVRSEHEHTEMQLCATTGRVLGVAERRSDWLENLHDGSWFGEGVHGWVMPATALGLLFLVFSGLWLWIAPVVKRRAKRKRHAAQRAQTARETPPA